MWASAIVLTPDVGAFIVDPNYELRRKGYVRAQPGGQDNRPATARLDAFIFSAVPLPR